MIEERASQGRVVESAKPVPPEPGSREEFLQGLQRDKPTPIDMGLTLEALGSFAIFALVAGIVFYLLRPWLMKKKVVKRQPLIYDKIITDDSNVRSAIRIALFRPLSVTALRIEGKSVEFEGRAASLDLSVGGMSLLSTRELPAQADISFSFHESEIASSPSLNGLVLGSSPWKEGEEGAPSPDQIEKQLGTGLFLVRLSFVNLSPEARTFLSRLISQMERESLAAMKAIQDDEDLKRSK